MEEPTSTTSPPAAGPTPSRNGNRIRAGLILAIIITCVILAGGYWWLRSKAHIKTDNAYIEAHLHSVSPKVAGRIEKVAVKDNQFVRKGDLLFEINPIDFRVKVDQAAAALDMSLNETSGEYAQIEQSRAELEQSRARLLQAESDLRRGKALFAREVIPKEQMERLETAVKVATAEVGEKVENLNKSRAEVG